MKNQIKKVNEFFIKEEKYNRILGNIFWYILIGANAIFVGHYPKETLAYILLTIIEICWALCFYFNFYISKKYYKAKKD